MGVGAANLRRLAICLVALLAAAACSQSTSQHPRPSPTPTLPGELVFITENGHVVAIEARDGAQVADLPGYFVATLDQGGDVAEAYLVSPRGLAAVNPGRPFVTTQVDTTPLLGPGVLVAAPNLQTFVGAKTILVVAVTDSILAGYQHGKRIWTVPVDVGIGRLTVRGIGGEAFVLTAGGVRPVVAETGELRPAPCNSLPVAMIGRGYLCVTGGGSQVTDTESGRTINVTGKMEAFHAIRSTDVYLQAGRDFYRLDKDGKVVWHRSVPDPGSNGAIAPDGSAFYLAGAGSGVRVVPTTTAPLTSIPGPHYMQVAVSRDGTFLYGLTSSSLDVLTLPDGRVSASYPVSGVAIELVAGG